MMAFGRQTTIKSASELETMRTAGRINAEALAAAHAVIRPGATTADLEAAVDAVHRQYGVYSPFKNYAPGGLPPYPSSITVCINEELVHGRPGKQRKLRSGDIVSVDCGTVYEGFHVTRIFTGHGVGRKMHEDPQVPNYGIPGRGMILQPGMTIALEPMVLVGTPHTYTLDDQWTVVSMDGSLTAHFEHTVAVTEDGPRILTLLEDDSSPAQITGHLRKAMI